MNKPLYLFVGKSGSGKTTIANILESEYGLNQLQSYTTRQKRYDNEIGHTFVTEDEFDSLQNFVAFTVYNGNKYGATVEQVDSCDVYVIDIPGVENLLEKYQNIDRPIHIMYFSSTVKNRIDRMLDRGDCDAAIVARLHHDDESGWERQLSKLTWHYKNILNMDIEMHTIDANQNIEKVLEQVKHCMEQKLED